jgi:hypothetical protein
MKGIYLTEESKQEIEAKIAELEKYKDSDLCKDTRDWSFVSGKQAALKEVLESATILPVEENWLTIFEIHGMRKIISNFQDIYPNGLIIQPKKNKKCPEYEKVENVYKLKNNP